MQYPEVCYRKSDSNGVAELTCEYAGNVAAPHGVALLKKERQYGHCGNRRAAAAIAQGDVGPRSEMSLNATVIGMNFPRTTISTKGSVE
jgi:hypothetical protein